MIGDLKKILAEQKLLLVCGSGGVGKTTLSAAIAMKAAIDGRKTVVLTIDPAKRLATSLGIGSLSYDPKRVPASLMKEFTGGKDAEFYAMMLDTKSTFDRIVSKYAPNKEVEKKILNNKLYQHLSSMIAGSQEYMAMEKLYEVVSEDKFDLVVIDTPPTVHAIDFLDAPDRMVNALTNSMVHILLKPAMMMGKSGFKLFEKGSQMVLKVFDRITGFAVLQDISELLSAFRELLAGFTQRAAQVKTILEDSQTSFIMVAACEDKSVSEVEIFRDKLRSLKLPMEGILVNRVHPYTAVSKQASEENEAELVKALGANLTEKVLANFEYYQKRAKRDRKYLDRFKDLLEKGQFLKTIPLFSGDVHDLEGLHHLSQYLD